MLEQLQFESGLSQNIFQASNTKARMLVSDSILIYLTNQLATLGISLHIDISLPKGPTLMDKVIDSNLSPDQMRTINKLRLEQKFLYWEPDHTGEYHWPRRTCTSRERILFHEALKSFRPSLALVPYYVFPTALNKKRTKFSDRLLQQARQGQIMASSDG